METIRVTRQPGYYAMLRALHILVDARTVSFKAYFSLNPLKAFAPVGIPAPVIVSEGLPSRQKYNEIGDDCQNNGRDQHNLPRKQHSDAPAGLI